MRSARLNFWMLSRKKALRRDFISAQLYSVPSRSWKHTASIRFPTRLFVTIPGATKARIAMGSGVKNYSCSLPEVLRCESLLSRLESRKRYQSRASLVVAEYYIFYVINIIYFTYL